MAKLFVLDLETSISKGPHSGTFRDPSNDFYTLIYGTNPGAIIVEHKEEGFKRQWSHGAADLLNKSDIIIGHNLTFDLSYLWKTKELQDFIKKGGTTWDTIIAEYLMSGQRHAFASLAELQLLYLDQKVKESRISGLFKKKHGADEIIKAKDRCPRIFKLFDKYSKDDGETTFKIALKQIERAKRLGMINIIKLYNLYMLGLVNTSTSGLKVDMLKCEKTLRAMKLKSLELLEQSESIVSKFWDNPKLPKFNVQSPTHKSALLFGGEIKVKVKYDDGFYKNGNPKTKTVEEHIPVVGFKLPTALTSPSEVKGRYRTGAEIIDKIYSHTKDPVVKEYCTLQRKAMNLEKMCSTYLEPFLKLSINGYLYPNYNNTATSTGRLSSSKPNLQNIPSKGGIEKYIKNQFIAPEGYICVSIDYCLDPKTKVLTEDFKWVEIGNVIPGDTLIGFEEHIRTHDGRKWESSKVLKTKRLIKECLKITTEEGEIICSKDHMFLSTTRGQCQLQWNKAENLNLKSTLTKVMEVWETPENYETGWAAGFLDGEGYLSNGSQIGFGQNADGHNKLCFDKMCILFDKYLINTENRVDTKRRCHKVRPAGMRTGWQAIGIFQPERLKQKLKEQYTSTTIRSKKNRKIKILKIEDIGLHEVCAIETSSHTFLAEGFLSHNCQLEIYTQALVTKDQSLINDLLSGVDFHILRLSYAEDMNYQDVYKLCKIDKLPEWELKRSRAKTISYQKAYGAAPKKLALSTGLDEEVIKKIFIKEDLNYPQVKEVNDKIAEEVAQNKELSMSRSIPQYQKGFTKYSKRFKAGIELLPIINANMETEYFEEECRYIGYYKSITGKRYAFEEFGMYDRLGRIKRGFKPTQIKNYPQQGGAADVVAAATAEIFKYILTLEDNDVLMINQVHDSIEFYVKEETKHLTLPKLKSIMEDVPYLFKKYLEVEVPFKFKCDVKIGENFYNMKEYK